MRKWTVPNVLALFGDVGAGMRGSVLSAREGARGF